MMKHLGSKISMETGSWTHPERAAADRTGIESISCETLGTLANSYEAQWLLLQSRVDKVSFKVSLENEVKAIIYDLDQN